MSERIRKSATGEIVHDLAEQVDTWISENKDEVLARLRTLGFGFNTISRVTNSLTTIKKASIGAFKYMDPIWKPYPIVLVSQKIANPSPATINTRFEYAEATQDVIEFGFSETLKVGTKASIKAELPLAGEASMELSAEVAFTADNKWTTLQEKDWAGAIEIQVPPESQVDVSLRLMEADTVVDFEAFATISKASVIVYGLGTRVVFERPIAIQLSLSQLKGVVPPEVLSATLKGTTSLQLGLQAVVMVEG